MAKGGWKPPDDIVGAYGRACWRIGRAARFTFDFLKSRAGFAVLAGVALALSANMLRLEFKRSQEQHRYERQEATGKQAGDDDAKISVKCWIRPALVPLVCAGDVPSSGGADKATEYDLKAQQDMASWAKLMFWTNAVGLLASFAGIWFVWANLVETRQIGQNQTRAYVHATKAQLYVSDGGTAGLIGGGPDSHVVTVWFENTGETPAIHVEAFARIWADQGRDEAIALEFDQESIVDAIVRGAPAELRFKLPKSQYRRPPTIGRGILEETDEIELGAGKVTYFAGGGDTDPVYGPQRMWDALIDDFSHGKMVYCRGEIQYMDVFRRRYRTEFLFSHFGAPRNGIFDMKQTHAKLAKFEPTGRRKPNQSS